MRKQLFLLIALAMMSSAGHAQQRLTFGASYTGDWMNNLSGGIRTGSGYLGMADLTADLRLWKGAQLAAKGVSTHGDTPSLRLIGDMQVASNIEAGNHSYLQEAWIKQRLGSFEVTLGLQDMAVELGNVEYGDLYLNSSFGVKSTISHNTPAPIFPLTNLGATFKWDISDRFAWVGAIYDGSPRDFDDGNPHNVRWDFGRGDGALLATEGQYHAARGSYKIGLVHGTRPSLTSYYVSAHHTFGERLGAFVQLGYVPHEQTSDHYLGAGVNFAGLLFDGDEAGLAVAHEHFRHDIRAETALELTWKSPEVFGFFLQPDLQYIIHPAATGERLKNALVATLRFGWAI